MLSLGPRLVGRRAPSLLFLGAHSDDIEIGCGGTVQELLDRHPRATVHWVVLSSGGVRIREAQQAARRLLGVKRRAHVSVHQFRTSFFPSEWAAIKQSFEDLKKQVSPDLIFTHYREDLHQDHRIVSELTWNTFRDHLILEYEIPKYDGGLGSPNAFVPVRRSFVDRKIDVLMKAFGSQRSKRWFTPDTFSGLMRLRGVESNAPSGYAEAFYARKISL